MGIRDIGIVNIIVLALRIIQLVFACAVLGLYAQDLNRAHKEDKYTDGKWVFVTVVASFSGVTALVYSAVIAFVSFTTISLLFAWDGVLFILWTTVFGLFGKLYIGTNTGMDSGIQRMKNAVWVDLVNMLLWFITFVMGGIGFWRGRGGRSLHTGRASLRKL